MLLSKVQDVIQCDWSEDQQFQSLLDQGFEEGEAEATRFPDVVLPLLKGDSPASIFRPQLVDSSGFAVSKYLQDRGPGRKTQSSQSMV